MIALKHLSPSIAEEVMDPENWRRSYDPEHST